MQLRCNVCRCNLDVILTHSYVNGTLILLFWLGVGLGGVGWSGVVGVVEDKAISAQPTEFELD